MEILYRMIIWGLFFLLFVSSPSLLAQKQRIYLMFNHDSQKQCIVEDEYGKKYSIKKYRINFIGKEKVKFSICVDDFIETSKKPVKINIDTVKITTINNLYRLEQKVLKKRISISSKSHSIQIMQRKNLFDIFIITNNEFGEGYWCHPVEWIEKSH
ncbi:hypothetical protein ACG2LH_04420 [Zhouia sp. PK063]|uniref:hypothetical protein n=1 Tax=Zhouia sp. PK063 TaxID=3373602 RepID=UPI00378ABD9E